MKIVIAGAGEVGFHLIERLHREGVTLSVIDTDKMILKELESQFHVQVDQSNIIDSRFLRKAHLKDADLFLAITNSDETNMIACKMAKSAGVIKTVCRIRSIQLEGAKKKASLESLGIDHIINPVELVADEIVQMVMAPNLVDRHLFDAGRLSFLGYKVQSYNTFIGFSIAEIHGKISCMGISVALLSRQERCFLPTQEHRIELADQLYFFCPTQNHQWLRQLMGYTKVSAKSKRVMINGGGHIGLRVARQLETTAHQVKVIETNETRAQKIAARLSKAMILQFDGTELKKLAAEGIDEQDFFISVTSLEEVNLTACLMAKQHSEAKAICLVKQQELIAILERATKIDRAISPRITTSRSLDRFFGGGRIQSAFSQGSMQVLELKLFEGSNWAGARISDLDLGDATAIGMLKREDQYLLPGSDTLLKEGDLVLLLVHRLDKPEILKNFGLAV